MARSLKLATANRQTTAVKARQRTIAATLVRDDPDIWIADKDDTDAQHKIIKAQVRKAAPKISRARRRTAVDRLEYPPPATGAALVERVTLAIEHELNQISRIVGRNNIRLDQQTGAERRARMLASLVRSLRVVRDLREDEPKADDDNAVPRDLDELRETLSRRLAQLDGGTSNIPAAWIEPS